MILREQCRTGNLALHHISQMMSCHPSKRSFILFSLLSCPLPFVEMMLFSN